MNLFGPKQRTVATVALSGHGKTVFLASLLWDTLELVKSFSVGEQRYCVTALTDKTDDVFYENAQTLARRKLPIPTQPTTNPEPATLQFTGVPRAISRKRKSIGLTFFDISGEAFGGSDSRKTNEYAPFLQRADDIVFLFDPLSPDFDVWSAPRLVNLVCRAAPQIEKKNLIIAFSKMDELRDPNHPHTNEANNWWANFISDFWPGAPPSPSGGNGIKLGV